MRGGERIKTIWIGLSIILLVLILAEENYLGNLEKRDYWIKIVVHEFALAVIVLGIPTAYVLLKEKTRLRRLLNNLHKLLTPEKLLR